MISRLTSQNFLRKRCRSVGFGALGFLAYAHVIRFRGLWPGDVDWTFRASDGDVAALDSTANYLGWEFYRRSPTWVWPIGKTVLLGPESGSSIGLTDSLPLLGIPLKFLLWWTEEPVQYLGIWVLLCFILQAVFAGRLLDALRVPRSILLPSVVLMTVLPTYLSRIGIHTPLSGHWVVLAALNLSFSDTLPLRKWTLLSVCAMAIQPYLGVMALLLCYCRVLGSWIADQRVGRGGIVTLTTTTLCSGFTAFQVGLFSFGRSALSTAGVGDFSANVMTLVDPVSDSPFAFTPSWSRFVLLPDVVDGPYQYEGFGFLGTGVILLTFISVSSWSLQSRRRVMTLGAVSVAAALLSALMNVPVMSMVALSVIVMVVIVWLRNVVQTNAQRMFAILALVTALILSVTNRVTLGANSFELFIPSPIVDSLGVVRVTGRFIWIVAFIVVIASITMVTRHVSSPKLRSVLIVACLIVQLLDSSYGVERQRKLLESRSIEPTLQSTLWKHIGNRYRSIAIVLPEPVPQIRNPSASEPDLIPNEDFWFAEGVLWADLGEFAAYRGIRLNAFYFGRDPLAAYEREAIELTDVVQNSGYADDTLYVFIDSRLWDVAKSQKRDGDVVGLLDGIPIVAPNLRSCTQCPLGEVTPVS